MADVKKYLDFVGLAHYDEKIKAYIKTNGSDVTDKLVTLIGAAEKGADEATILARIADLESAVGDVSQLDAEVADLVKAILGESARAKAAEKANADAIDALDVVLHGSDDEEGNHAAGEIDTINARLKALEDDTDDADAIEVLEKKLYGYTTEGDEPVVVKGDIEKLQDAIDAEAERAEGVEGTLASLTTDEKTDLVSAINEIDAHADAAQKAAEDEETARKAQIGELGKVSEEEGAADHTVKSYVDAAIEAINGDAEALEGRVDALEATHATKEDGSFKTVAEEVNEAVTDLIDGAPDALDTLKEIADWIANQDESGVTDAATLVARVEANTQAISDETERAEGAESDLQDAIDAVEEKIDAFERITDTEIDKLFGEVSEEPKTEETT